MRINNDNMPEGEMDDAYVEEQIVGEFMMNLHENEVDFELVEEIETLIDEADFGGEDRIIELIENNVIDYED